MEDTEAMDSRPPLASLSPSRQNTETAGDVDFSKLTPSQFGISTDSFISSSKIKDKSRVAQLKARRRSTIGVRGSPETNSLICFRARQAAKTPPRTPQLLQGSPFLSRCDSLKKKMAAFQCLMEEEDEEDELKKNEENESEKSTLAKDSKNGKENTLTVQSPFTLMTPPPSKKRCWAPPGECEDKITETPLPNPSFTTQQEQEVKCSESQSQRPLSGVDSDAKNELLSLPMLSKPDVKPADNMGSSIRKKKHVRFGAPLSPEFFDKTLPPSTPLQKGGTPMCPPSSTGPKRSLLKTPQRCEAPLPQPDFNSPQFNGSSPVLVIDRHSAGLLYSDEVFGEIEKISFPSIEDESPSHKPSENCKDILFAEDPRQPRAEDAEVMNAAFQEEEDEPSNSQTEDKLPCPTVEVDQESESSAISEKALSSNSSTEPTRSRSRKRKQPGESEPEKRRSSRTAAASASGKMKKTSGVKKRFGNKEVDRSLYGKRDYASKNPLLSPIFETMSTSLINTPTQTQSGKLTDGEQDNIQTPNVPYSKTVQPMVILGTACSETNENEATLSSTVTDTTDNQSDMNATCLEPSVGTRGPAGKVNSGSKTSKAKRGSGRPERQRRSSGAAKRKELSSTAINSTTELDCESGEQDTLSQKPTESAGLSPVYQDSSDVQFWPVHHEAKCSENKEIEALNSLAPNEDSITTERLEQKTPSGKRRGRVQKVLKSPCVKIDFVVEEVHESGQSEQITVDTSESNTGPTEPSLAPWQQADFNIDDILRPVAKSRGSVRRSLRNRRSVDLQAVGLAWVDHTSPELSKAGRRRTRGRLSGVSEPFIFQASEEPTPNLGE